MCPRTLLIALVAVVLVAAAGIVAVLIPRDEVIVHRVPLTTKDGPDAADGCGD
jgi:hypothetical protein